MPRSSAILRQSEHHADGSASSVASVQRQRAGAANEEPQFPLSIGPPLSIASSAPADPISSSGLSLRVHSDLDEVREQWKAFEQQADRTVFQSFDWLAAWQRHIGARRGTVPAIVLGRDADGQLLFILQLAIETHGLTRRLTWLGSQLCDYNAPLLAEPFSDRMSAERFVLAWQDVIKLLCADPRWQFDLIDLQKMPEAVGAQRNPFLDLRVLAHPSGAYDTELWLYDHLAAGTLQGSLVMATTTAFRRTKRIIKQSPALWRAFSKARALAGLLGRP
jgi:CelD/BcsL family acetyltransferase involved in cellulose biosynthesis